MHPRTRLVYFYFFGVNFLVKASTSGRCDQVWLPWQRCICRSRYGCFCLCPQVTYLHTKIEGGLKFFISNFASLSWRIVLNNYYHTTLLSRPYRVQVIQLLLPLPKRLKKIFDSDFLNIHKSQTQTFCIYFSWGRCLSKPVCLAIVQFFFGGTFDKRNGMQFCYCICSITIIAID